MSLPKCHFQGRSNHIRTYTRAYLENLEKNILFIYLFVYLLYIDYFCENRLIHMQEFSLVIAAILRKENCEYCTIHYDFNMRVQNPVITTVMVETLVSTCTAERSFSDMKGMKTLLRSTMSEERLSSLVILHIHERKNVDVDNLVSKFSYRKGRRLALFL